MSGAGASVRAEPRFVFDFKQTEADLLAFNLAYASDLLSSRPLGHYGLAGVCFVAAGLGFAGLAVLVANAGKDAMVLWASAVCCMAYVLAIPYLRRVCMRRHLNRIAKRGDFRSLIGPTHFTAGDVGITSEVAGTALRRRWDEVVAFCATPTHAILLSGTVGVALPNAVFGEHAPRREFIAFCRGKLPQAARFAENVA